MLTVSTWRSEGWLNYAQLIISVPLFLVLCFMIGFILNMLIKTTWLPLVIYAGLVLWVLYKTEGIFQLPEYVVFFSGLAGTILSIISIHMLRKRGYSMFWPSLESRLTRACFFILAVLRIPPPEPSLLYVYFFLKVENLFSRGGWLWTRLLDC